MKTEGYVITDCRNNDIGDVYFMYKNKDLAEKDLWTYKLMGSYRDASVEELPMIEREDELAPIPDMIFASVRFGLGTGEINPYIYFVSEAEFDREGAKIGDVRVRRIVNHMRSDHYLDFIYAMPWIPMPENPSDRNASYTEKVAYDTIKKKLEEEDVFHKLTDLFWRIHAIRLTVQQTGPSDISINTYVDFGSIELVDKYGQLTADLFIGLMECFKREFGAAIQHILDRYIGYMITEDTEDRIFDDISRWITTYELGDMMSSRTCMDIKKAFRYYLRENELPGKYVKPW